MKLIRSRMTADRDTRACETRRTFSFDFAADTLGVSLTESDACWRGQGLGGHELAEYRARDVARRVAALVEAAVHSEVLALEAKSAPRACKSAFCLPYDCRCR